MGGKADCSERAINRAQVGFYGRRFAGHVAAPNGDLLSSPACPLAAGRGAPSGRSVRTFRPQYYAARIQFDKCAIAPSPGTSKKKTAPTGAEAVAGRAQCAHHRPPVTP